MDDNNTDNQDLENLNQNDNQNLENHNDNQGGENQKKSKEENFDGVVKKLNAKEKELKKVFQQLQELQGQINSKNEDTTNSEKNELAELKKAIEELKNEKQKEAFNNKLENSLSTANIDSKFNKLAKTVLQDIANENSLDLSDKSELNQAIELLTKDYSEFLSKKPKQIGIVNGQTSNSNTGLSVLEGNAEGYFKLSDNEKKALISKVFKK
jgi:hypothetical protein